jgi:hypothetical protein
MLPFRTIKSQNVAKEAVANALKAQISSGTRSDAEKHSSNLVLVVRGAAPVPLERQIYFLRHV